MSASLKHEGLNSCSQETRKATSPGIKLMLFGHLTESVPCNLQSPFLEHSLSRHQLTLRTDAPGSSSLAQAEFEAFPTERKL